jgi:hypothetical protein
VVVALQKRIEQREAIIYNHSGLIFAHILKSTIMKRALFIFMAIFLSFPGFSQESNIETYEEFQDKLNSFKVLVATNSDLIVNASDKEEVGALADEIRKMSKKLSQDVSEVYKCTNPNLGQKLTMSYALADVSPVLSNLYFNRAFVNDTCPEEKSNYEYHLERIRHLAWRMKFSDQVEKKIRLSEEMLEALAVI